MTNEGFCHHHSFQDSFIWIKSRSMNASNSGRMSSTVSNDSPFFLNWYVRCTSLPFASHTHLSSLGISFTSVTAIITASSSESITSQKSDAFAYQFNDLSLRPAGEKVEQ